MRKDYCDGDYKYSCVLIVKCAMEELGLVRLTLRLEREISVISSLITKLHRLTISSVHSSASYQIGPWYYTGTVHTTRRENGLN